MRVVAGVADVIATRGYTVSDLDAPGAALREEVLGRAAICANAAAKNIRFPYLGF